MDSQADGYGCCQISILVSQRKSNPAENFVPARANRRIFPRSPAVQQFGNFTRKRKRLNETADDCTRVFASHRGGCTLTLLAARRPKAGQKRIHIVTEPRA
jgi:hypothetical protein